jgi:pimeloyl-ACP methyl ester carboxylesterase
MFAVLVLTGFLAVGVLYEQVSRRRDAKRFPPIGRLVDVGGRRLHLFSKGSVGPAVVIEQGAGGPSLAWLGVQEQISEFARVCIYDRAGYQWSDPVAGARSLEDRVEDLHTLLVNAEVPGPYVLAAHSYGGFLVRLFAKQYPGSVAGLVLVDTPHESSYFRPEVLSAYGKFRWMLNLMGLLSRFGLPRLLNRLFSKPDQISSGMVRHEYFGAASDDIASLQRAASWLTKPEALGSLGDLPMVVITHGQPFPGPFAVLEKGWRDGQERLAALSTNSRLVVASKSNHMIQNDEPQVIAEAVRAALGLQDRLVETDARLVKQVAD